jgi:hypothetical protein
MIGSLFASPLVPPIYFPSIDSRVYRVVQASKANLSSCSTNAFPVFT